MRRVPHFALCGLAFLGLCACRPDGARGPGVQPDAPAAPTAGPAATFFLCRAGLPEAGNWKCDPVLADLNGDGRLDLAGHPRLGDGPHVWLGDGAGGWQSAAEELRFRERSCGGGLAVADFDGDGHLDLAVADHCRGLYVYLGDGAGRWEAVVREMPFSEFVPPGGTQAEYVGAEDVDAGDVNGDGHIDLVAGASDAGGLAVFLGDGTGRGWQRSEARLGAGGLVNRVLLADLNEDGHLDIAASCAEGPRVWLGDGQGGWRPASDGLPTPSIGGLFHGLTTGDVNEDGRPDLIVSNWVDGPEVYLQRADGRWEKTADVFPEMRGGSYGVAAGDLDRDGHLDLLVSGRLSYELGFVYGVFLLRGDGAGHWTFERGSGLPLEGLPFTWGIALGDVNGDQVLDVVAGSGGIVATDPKHPAATLDAGLLVWCTRLSRP